MIKVFKSDDEKADFNESETGISTRRDFLKWSSAAALTAFAFGALSPESLSAKMAFAGLPIDDDKAGVVDVGKGDIGILNFTYANEQLEAAFYTQVIATPYARMTADERAILTDIRDNEIAHREFFRAQLGKKAIPNLQVNFTSINFNSRDSVLRTAQMFEDNGTAVLNGSGQLLKNPLFLLIAGKLVSVEARHAATLRDLIQPMSTYFSGDDITDPATGLDPARTPAQAFAVIKPFVATPVSIARLPQPKA
ncbi:MAG TPA: ferritin-like domain-containing protein [Pyrinomonadaceae bacterium]|nr:ferritin-like domain-containing protein [Pyrinomonadaceae bacterium]